MDESHRLPGVRVWVMAKGYRPDEGGMQTYAEGVALAYAARGAAVTVFTQSQAGPRRQRSGELELIDVGPGNSPRAIARLLRALQAALRDQGPPALVHGTTWRTSLLPMLHGLPYVATFHGREFMYPSGLALMAMREVAARARLTVAVSAFSAARLRERLGSSSTPALVAFNGPSAGLAGASVRSSLAEPTGQPPLVLSVSRLEPRKNIAAALAACARLIREGYRFRYVIAGRGPELERIHEMVARLGLGARIDVAGFVTSERLAGLYARADVFLHPHVSADRGRDFEGFGIAIADAMHARTAVIIGRDGGSGELVQDGDTGWIVAGQSIDEIAARLRTLLDHPEARRAMAHRAAVHAAREFCWDRHVESILDALAGCQAAPSPAGPAPGARSASEWRIEADKLRTRRMSDRGEGL